MFEQMSRYGDGQSDRRGRMTFELQRWSEDHWHDFATLHRDADVMADLGDPFDDTTSREKFDRYRQAWDRTGISRWAVVDGGREQFSGYAGVMLHSDPDHPLGQHYEVGWRFRRDVWGKLWQRRVLARLWSGLGLFSMCRKSFPIQPQIMFVRRTSCGVLT